MPLSHTMFLEMLSLTTKLYCSSAELLYFVSISKENTGVLVLMPMGFVKPLVQIFDICVFMVLTCLCMSIKVIITQTNNAFKKELVIANRCACMIQLL